MKRHILPILILTLAFGVKAQKCDISLVRAVNDTVSINFTNPVKPQYNSIVSTDGGELMFRIFDCDFSQKTKPTLSGKPSYIESLKVNKLIVPPLTSITEVLLKLKKKAGFNISSAGKMMTIRLRPPDGKIITKEELKKEDRFMSSKYDYNILENLPTMPVSLDYTKTPVKDVINIMAARIGLNVVYSDDVRGSVTIRLKNVPFEEAFKMVLSNKKLTAQQQEGSKILRVVPMSTAKKEEENAPLETKFFPLKYQNVKDLKKVIEDVIKAEGRKGKVNADVQSNALIVTDIQSGIASIGRLLGQIDRKPMQVSIETKIVEVNINNAFDLGIQWSAYGADTSTMGGRKGINYFGSGNTDSQGAPVAFTPAGLYTPYTTSTGTGGTTSTAISTPLPNIPGAGGTGVSYPTISNAISVGAFRFGRITNNYLLDMTLNAAEQKGKVKILSEPKVTTLNNREAKIKINTEIPYTTTTTTPSNPPVVNTIVTYIDTGITLEVTPQVNAEGRITMKVKPTISQVAATVPTAAGGAPGVDTRSAETIVMTKNGETIVIGGLIYDIDNNVTYKVPLLGDIPLLGWFFKTKHNNKQRIELLVFVTPKIVEG